MNTIIKELDNMNSNIDVHIRKVKNIKKFILNNNLKLENNNNIIKNLILELTNLKKKLKKCEDIENLNKEFESISKSKDSQLIELKQNLNTKENEIKKCIDSKNFELNKLKEENIKLKGLNNKAISEVQKIDNIALQPTVSHSPKKLPFISENTKEYEDFRKNIIINKDKPVFLEQQLNIIPNINKLHTVHKKTLITLINNYLKTKGNMKF